MSDRLIAALGQVKQMEPITLGSIVDHLQEEALLILSLIAILPFMQPIPIPGLSSILGLIILLQGLGLIIWGKPVLTQRMRAVVISREKFEIIEKAAAKFSYYAAKFSAFKHPHVSSRVVQIIAGTAIVLSSGFLSLPLPIPFSNFVPALSIFLICVGLLEEDIVLLLMGLGITLMVIWMAVFSYQLIMEQFQNWF